MTDNELSPPHLSAGEVAAYHDHHLAAAVRARVEDHLANCVACRSEVIETGRLMRSFQAARTRRRLVPLAAAAAALLLLAPPWLPHDGADSPTTRDSGENVARLAVAIAPVGQVTRVDHLVWSSAPRADRYRITLFDAQATVLWKTDTRDTMAALPDSIHLAPGHAFYWMVETRTGWNRWASSPLTEFTPASGGPRR